MSEIQRECLPVGIPPASIHPKPMWRCRLGVAGVWSRCCTACDAEGGVATPASRYLISTTLNPLQSQIKSSVLSVYSVVNLNAQPATLNSHNRKSQIDQS